MRRALPGRWAVASLSPSLTRTHSHTHMRIALLFFLLLLYAERRALHHELVRGPLLLTRLSHATPPSFLLSTFHPPPTPPPITTPRDNFFVTPTQCSHFVVARSENTKDTTQRWGGGDEKHSQGATSRLVGADDDISQSPWARQAGTSTKANKIRVRIMTSKAYRYHLSAVSDVQCTKHTETRAYYRTRPWLD